MKEQVEFYAWGMVLIMNKDQFSHLQANLYVQLSFFCYAIVFFLMTQPQSCQNTIFAWIVQDITFGFSIVGSESFTTTEKFLYLLQ